MEAAGRESYAPAAERQSAYAAKASAEALAGLADELLAVAGLLAREPRLRRALVDPARSPDDRVGLIREVLRGKVGDEALAELEAVVGGRWPGPNALRDAVERLGVDAVLASAERADELGEVEDELFRFGQVVDGAPKLAAVLGDPAAPVEQRASLITDLLGDKAKATTVRLAQVALTGFGGRSFGASLSRLVELAAARRDRQVAYVTSAIPLSDEVEERLGTQLSRRYGRSVSLKVTIDPEILGGLSVQIGSDLYDGTVLRRLIEARTALTK
ncbi:MAG: ATP synthase F1 subunit delta [Actinobacteria bacterium 13_2_20CM_2_71_6]|nr:MAG: ATP synthase F1 subunit delta [Actinobacteria bacterium 13_2_20CM_2_71_6]